MATQKMSDFLLDETADYTANTLTVTPSVVLVSEGAKDQVKHKFHGGNFGTVTYDNNSFFDVTLQWKNISDSDAGTIMNMWHNNDRANGVARSFYWYNIKDGETYTVKFMTSLTRSHRVDAPDFIDIRQLKLRVIGNKP